MSLEKKLREASYDLINSPILNKRELQLWELRKGETPSLYADHISEVFKSNETLTPTISKALSVTSSDVKTHKFDTGVSFVKEILSKMNLGKGNISSVIKTGKSVDISYDGSEVWEYPILHWQRYIQHAEYDKTDRLLREALDRDNLVLISGILYATNFSAQITTDFDVTTTVESDVRQLLDAKVEVATTGKNTLTIKADGNEKMPIAVQAFKLEFKRNEFRGAKLLTDHVGLLDRDGLF